MASPALTESVPEFLYIFGYMTPEQAKANTAHGWDDEDSEAVFIERRVAARH